jgi:hypothetical protein
MVFWLPYLNRLWLNLDPGPDQGFCRKKAKVVTNFEPKTFEKNAQAPKKASSPPGSY